jgi:hypothetical protein
MGEPAVSADRGEDPRNDTGVWPEGVAGIADVIVCSV